ncbi:MAG: type II secretion system protein GspG [Archangium sp.]
MRRRRQPRGISLIEIVVYITIASMLMAAVGVYAVGVQKDSMRRTAELDVRTALDAVEMYRGSRGRYPDDFAALVKAKVLKSAPKDPWGNLLVLSMKDGEPVVTSLGADGREGGEEENEDISAR